MSLTKSPSQVKWQMSHEMKKHFIIFTVVVLALMNAACKQSSGGSDSTYAFQANYDSARHGENHF